MDILIGQECQKDGFETGLGNGLASFWFVVDIYSHPDKFSIVDEETFTVRFSYEEIVFNESHYVIDNGFCGDLSLVISVFVEEAVKEKLSEILIVDASEFLKRLV